ncbi:laccase, multicopper oxidase, benzenediol:oxygen oxidorectuctase [Purpureocillium lilacinum]|uniref:laccase, multicopper oxidase, benzenediol:oxygen oxidorectuctase n=1 Tax=Purpureocillium lilacinum TaxID=33203 RepID=UPI00208BC42B|nr:laccase, multicopper oxidase, benzenediol:oxygen oxidorectuctase [Purpureocillium lilacinum]
MRSNGTAMHWHGVRQLNSNEYDGVPGVTQCPIPPGETHTYKFRVTQYGTGWYHSHLSFQTAEGVFGPIIFNGPATADYDEDLGAMFLQDWAHESTFAIWDRKEKFGVTYSLSNTLMNGTNTFNCPAGHRDKNCVGDGKKFQTVFKKGKKYRLRLINSSIDSDYWIRGGWNEACVDVANDLPEEMTGIVRYDAASKADPTSTDTVKPPSDCADEPQASLVPQLKLDVTNITDTTVEELSMLINGAALLQWTINSSTLLLDWKKPTLKRILAHDRIFPTSYNVVPVDASAPNMSCLLRK